MNGCQHKKGAFPCKYFAERVQAHTSSFRHMSCAGIWIETRSDPGALHCALLISSSSALATQVPVKISLVSGRPRQKQGYSPCQISLGVAGDRQERALAIANSEVLDGFKLSFK